MQPNLCRGVKAFASNSMSKQSPHADARPAFHATAKAVASAWGLGCIASCAVTGLVLPSLLLTSLVIAIGSLFVSVNALLPGLLQERAASRPIKDYSAVLLASVLLRLVGTVALFAMCSYQMAQSDETTAAFALGWYVYLTSVEIITLSKSLPSSDARRTSRAVETKPNIPTICQG